MQPELASARRGVARADYDAGQRASGGEQAGAGRA